MIILIKLISERCPFDHIKFTQLQKQLKTFWICLRVLEYILQKIQSVWVYYKLPLQWQRHSKFIHMYSTLCYKHILKTTGCQCYVKGDLHTRLLKLSPLAVLRRPTDQFIKIFLMCFLLLSSWVNSMSSKGHPCRTLIALYIIIGTVFCKSLLGSFD